MRIYVEYTGSASFGISISYYGKMEKLLIVSSNFMYILKKHYDEVEDYWNRSVCTRENCYEF